MKEIRRENGGGLKIIEDVLLNLSNSYNY
jgi:hypothetical protein